MGSVANPNNSLEAREPRLVRDSSNLFLVMEKFDIQTLTQNIQNSKLPFMYLQGMEVVHPLGEEAFKMTMLITGLVMIPFMVLELGFMIAQDKSCLTA